MTLAVASQRVPIPHTKNRPRQKSVPGAGLEGDAVFAFQPEVESDGEGEATDRNRMRITLERHDDTGLVSDLEVK
jgi:hypothetical protein